MGFVKRVIDQNFHALTNTNYRYFWFGQCVSLIGTWMQSIGQAWLVFTLTDSAFLLGVFAAMQFVPVTTLSLFAGVLIDKFPKKMILLITQGTSMILALTLAALVFTGSVKYEYLLIMAVLLGITNSIDIPTRQSFLIEIAGREDLMNAIALNSATFNLAKILGPALGAALLASFGAGWCFFINGVSFIAVLYGLAKIKVEAYVRVKTSRKILGEIVDGLRYIYRNKILLQSVISALVMGIFAFNYNVLMPVYVRNVLLQDANGFGIIMASLGVGSLFGALTVSGKNRSEPRMNVMFISSVLVGLLYVFIGFSTVYVLTILMLTAVGAFTIYFSTNINTMLQVYSQNEYRGRVMSVYSMVFSGANPIGSLFCGAAITGVGILGTFKLSGALMVVLIAAVSLLFIRKQRPIALPS